MTEAHDLCLIQLLNDGEQLTAVSVPTLATLKPFVIYSGNVFERTSPGTYIKRGSYQIDTDPAVDLIRSLAGDRPHAADELADRFDEIDSSIDDLKTLIRNMHNDLFDRLTFMRSDVSDLESLMDDFETELKLMRPETEIDPGKPIGRISIARSSLYHTRLAIAKFAFSLAAGAVIATAILLVTGDRDRVVLPGMILAGSVFVGSWVKP